MQPRLIRPRELATPELDWTGRWRGVDIWRVLNAARDGDVAALRAEIEADAGLANAEFWYMTPLHFAVRERHLEAVRALVDAGADLTYRSSLYGNDTLLQMALDRGHEEVATYVRRQLRARSVLGIPAPDPRCDRGGQRRVGAGAAGGGSIRRERR